MKTENLLGIEIKVRNAREARLVRIMEQQVERMINRFLDPIVEPATAERIVKRDTKIIKDNAIETRHLISALYFMEIITPEQLDTLSARNADFRWRFVK